MSKLSVQGSQTERQSPGNKQVTEGKLDSDDTDQLLQGVSVDSLVTAEWISAGIYPAQLMRQ